MVCMSHTMQWSCVARPCMFPVQYSLAHGAIHYCIDRSSRVMSADYCTKTSAWVKLASFSDSSLASWISTQSAMPSPAAALHYKRWVTCMWPLTSSPLAVFAHRSEVWLLIQDTHAIRHWWDEHEWCYLLKNTAWSSPWSSPWTVYSPGFTLTPHIMCVLNYSRTTRSTFINKQRQAQRQYMYTGITG